MKSILLLLAVVMGFTTTAHAMMPITEATVKAAQSFGVQNKATTAKVMLDKWRVYDSKKTNRYGNKENVIIYTPYLATAIDAKRKAGLGQAQNYAYSMELAKGYQGILALATSINSSFKADPKFLKVHIKQGNKTITPYEIDPSTFRSREVSVDKKHWDNKGKVFADTNSNVDTKKLNEVKKEVETKGKANVKGTTNKPAVAPKATTSQPAPKVLVKVWDLEYFIYFDLSLLNPTAPMTLVVSDQAAGDREFRLNLAAVK